jgi:hypothetical protein
MMAIHETEVLNQSSTANVNLTYTVIGKPVNSTTYYQVNYTEDVFSPSSTNGTLSGAIYFLPNGTATKLTIDAIT